MTDLAAFLALTLYLLCSLLLILRIQGKAPCASCPIIWLLAPGFIAVLLHAVVLYNNLITAAGLQFGLSNAASAIGAVIGLLVLLMSVKRQTIVLAAVVLPIAAVSILLELLFPVSRLLPPDSATGLKIHVLVSIIAYSLLGLAALMSLILAMQNHMLHNHHSGGVLRHLPPLQTTEKLMFDAITAG
ncbi:MAG TPA: cytochrome c biogenesis protein CcsA, partial [Gammaproteobacteria bacterium]|nr:cytochrome c biogenesis protein CcsA [Gammaproteobacteria bacterium]